MMNSDAQVLELMVGEQYRYNQQLYDIQAITSDVVELVSVAPHGITRFQTVHRLEQAAKRGSLVRVREAPFEGRQHRIVAALCEKDLAVLNRRIAYVTRAIKVLGVRLPRKTTLEVIDLVAEQITDSHRPCYNTLRNWVQLYRNGNLCTCALIPTKKLHTNQWERLPEIIREAIDDCLHKYYYIEEPECISDIVDAIQARLEKYNHARPVTDQIIIPSVSTLRRRIREKSEYLRLLKQKGLGAALKASKWSRKIQHCYRLLERIEGDTHSVDVELVNDDGETIGKAALTVLIDVASRKIIGWDLSINAASVHKSMRALKPSLSKYGVGAEYRLDNGSENTDKDELDTALPLLGPDITYCKVHTPDEKPFVERWFKTLITGYTHHLQGTTFSSLTDRGDYPSERKAMYTLAELRTGFEDWLENIYHQRYHSEIRMSPNKKWEELSAIQPPIRRLCVEEILRTFVRHATSKVTNGRVRYKNLQWTCPELFALEQLGKRGRALDLILDPADLGTAMVFHPDFPDKIFYADAVDARYQSGLTLDFHLLINKQINLDKKQFDFRLARDQKIRMMEDRYERESKRGRRRAEKIAEKARSITAPSSSKQALEPEAGTAAQAVAVEYKLTSIYSAPLIGEVWEDNQND